MLEYLTHHFSEPKAVAETQEHSETKADPNPQELHFLHQALKSLTSDLVHLKSQFNQISLLLQVKETEITHLKMQLSDSKQLKPLKVDQDQSKHYEEQLATLQRTLTRSQAHSLHRMTELEQQLSKSEQQNS